MKITILTAAFCAVLFSANAQCVTLLAFESYTVADKFETQYGYGKIYDSFQWGAGLEFEVQPNTAVELIYQRMDPEFYYDDYYYGEYLAGKIGLNYILLGATQYQPFSDVVSGFGTFDMGAGFTSAGDLDISNATKFTIGGRLGLRIAPSDKLSLRIHAQIMSPIQWIGGGFYFGTGGGGASVSSGSTIWQFNIGGSVNYRIR